MSSAPRSIGFSTLAIVASLLGAPAGAQVSVGAAAAASAPGASASANGGTGGVGLGGVGTGVGLNQGLNAGAGQGPRGNVVGNGALSGPRARLNAQRDLPASSEPGLRPSNAGQRALATDDAARGKGAAP